MKQLEMRRLSKAKIDYVLPDGYTVTNFRTPEEKFEYYYIYHEEYATEEEMNTFFDTALTNYEDCVPTRDTFFIKYGKEYVGTVTAIFHPKSHSGYVHMVCIRNDFRGKNLARVLNGVALNRLLSYDPDYILLTTDDFRIPAIKSYLKSDFLPVLNETMPWYQYKMLLRWKKIYRFFGIPKITYLTLKMKTRTVKV